MLNLCQFIGNLGGDPEVRSMPSGEDVANFSVAVTEKWNDSQGQKQERTEWVRCVAFGKLAGICAQYLSKGSKVYVAGKMKTRKWQDQSGQDKYTTEVVIRDMEMLGGSQGDAAPTQGQSKGRPAKAPHKPAQEPVDAFDDDIPF